MRIIRVNSDREYTCIPNDALRDSRLSLAARGLHNHILSCSGNWDIALESLAEAHPDEIDGAIAELERHGYIIRYQVLGQDGGLQWKTVPKAGIHILEEGLGGAA